MNKRIECKVTGRVQMVMYRDFATRKARALGLVGWVMNNADGSVSVVAEGESEALTVYIQKLRKGSVLSRVDHVEAFWQDPTNAYASFEIRL